MILSTKPKRKRTTSPKTSTENEDRLSDLPDCVLIHILSFLNTKQAFQTCILSTRWKHLPKYLQTLKLTSTYFKSEKTFNKFVSRISSLRDDSTALHTLDFICDEEVEYFVEPETLKSVVEYAVSHNVQRLGISITCDIQQFSHCLFLSKTLTSLDLYVKPILYYNGKLVFPNYLNLPALTRLSLKHFYFSSGNDDDGCAEPFSAFNKLNTLIIKSCRVLNAQILCIKSTTLVNLTIIGHYHDDSYKCKLELAAPSLCNFAFTGTPNQKLCGNHLCSVKLCSVKHLYIDANIGLDYDHPVVEDSKVLLSWLLEFANIKSLAVSSSTLQVLFLVPDLFKVKLTSLCNLESLKVIMKGISSPLYDLLRETFELDLKQARYIPNGVVDFLLQNSPAAKVDII